MVRWLIMACLVWAGLATNADAKRVALVVANNRYVHVSALKNPASDARLVSDALRRAGFQVDTRADLGKVAVETALRDFSRKAEGADVALIYYAGHGIEAGGENYLIPVDAKLERDRDLDVEATKLETALRMGEGARMRIVILDACRNNPFLATMQRGVRNRAVGRGLAAIEPEGETLVVYAAKAGATAADGEGANSPFAEALATRLVQPGLEIGLMFRAVRDDVLRKTGRVQEPFTYGSLSGNAFYFVAPAKTGPAVATAAPRPAPAPTVSDESLFWQGALSANTETSFRDYLTRYPKGRYAGLARDNIARLKQPALVSGSPGVEATSPVRPSRFDNGLIPNMSRAFSANGSPLMPPGDSEVAIRRFDFVPDQARRAKAREKILRNFGKPGSDQRKQFEASFPLEDPFRLLAPVIARHGLSADNAVDAALLQFEIYRKSSNQNWREPTVIQIAAARRQIAGAMLKDPFFKVMRGVELQDAADEMLYVATLSTHTLTGVEKLGASTLRQFRENMPNLMESIYGFSTETLRLTDQGYVK
jgi:hypothetical protein